MTPRRPAAPGVAIDRWHPSRAGRRACLLARRRPPALPPCWPAGARVAGKP
ncbi:hypothetical protein AZ22_0077 [Bordetella bronchiseptica 980-2]|uniref:Uncharacterized protein n=1 Tax=Bordetella bronchiseptica 00-P-2796 TaxID=1331199 RepID=A0ABR4R736_BORBO|nr:hypothetical protein AZ22_0077 [Bordetella bronchiseptica 980-2]KCV30534.1 hypothetical protein L490_0353 [Bordetella bronchiseptica 00-P-2796]KCV48719.1 hypothetical protein L491_0600 [Bordetella bronchiseptica 3E44]KCV55012.1 hypothetical protein AZ14_0526 [Bordetella bronchiseptica 980]KDB58889.1 hypothetical protein AZ16_0616 [Bordetella bronchiseptica B18-5 (C3)]KDB83806.1 hypothetical protein L495_0635 [Bordetella bronchiseptica CARE970018BB]KDB88005.1 hypothetical protein AZ27_0622 